MSNIYFVDQYLMFLFNSISRVLVFIFLGFTVLILGTLPFSTDRDFAGRIGLGITVDYSFFGISSGSFYDS